jgi:hypothetical protein
MNHELPADNPEKRAQIDNLKRVLVEVREKHRSETKLQNLAGRKLAAIEIRGLSDEAGRDLLSRLPVHEGDTLSLESIEAAKRIVKEYDDHLEFGIGPEPEGAVMRIQPSGSGDAPLILRK